MDFQGKGAGEVSDVLGCTKKHVYYRFEQKNSGIPFKTEGSTICLSRSLYEAYRFAQARKHANWDKEETGWVEMHLAVRKAAALIEQLAERVYVARKSDAGRTRLLCGGYGRRGSGNLETDRAAEAEGFKFGSRR
jgi:hypothetical protein